MIRSASLAILCSPLIGLVAPQSAVGDTCTGGGQGGDDYFAVEIECQTEATADATMPGPAPAQTQFVEYRWVSSCASGPQAADTDFDCARAFMCSDPNERLWILWGRTPSSEWLMLGSRCAGSEPEAPQPQVTPGLVLQALREVGLPALETRVQPEDKTLVNFDTIFFAEPRTVDVDLTILGQAVHVVAVPRSFHWDFGDGARLTTVEPGGPYPDKTVVHRYRTTAAQVEPQVTVEYAARFRLAGGSWQDISETVSIAGPPTPIAVTEAAGVLSGDHD